MHHLRSLLYVLFFTSPHPALFIYYHGAGVIQYDPDAPATVTHLLRNPHMFVTATATQPTRSIVKLAPLSASNNCHVYLSFVRDTPEVNQLYFEPATFINSPSLFLSHQLV